MIFGFGKPLRIFCASPIFNPEGRNFGVKKANQRVENSKVIQKNYLHEGCSMSAHHKNSKEYRSKNFNSHGSITRNKSWSETSTSYTCQCHTDSFMLLEHNNGGESLQSLAKQHSVVFTSCKWVGSVLFFLLLFFIRLKEYSINR